MKFTTSLKKLKKLPPFFIIVATTFVLVACGSNNQGGATDQGGTNSEQTGTVPAALTSYSGPESGLPETYPEPSSEGNFTIGFLNPLAANEANSVLQRAIEIQTQKLGGTVVSRDNELSVDKQVSDFNQLISQDVDAIIVFPLDPSAIRSPVERAEQAGIPVMGQEVTFGRDATAPGIFSQVWYGRDHQAFLQVQQMAQINPGGNIGVIGIGAPVPSLKYYAERVQFWAEKAGLNVLGVENNPTDDPSGGTQAMDALLNRYPDLNGVIAYNDPSALGATASTRSAGRDITVIGLNGGSSGREAVRSERIAATAQIDVVGMGVESVNGVYNYLNGGGDDLPEVVLREPRLITSENVDEVPTWDEQLRQLEESE